MALNEFLDMLSAIEDDALRYHLSNDPEPDIARKIKRKLSSLSRRLAHAYGDPAVRVCNDRIYQLRRAITLRNFDSATKRALLATDKLFDEIAICVDAIRDDVEATYQIRFRK